MFSQKTSRQVFHLNKHKCVKKHFIEKRFSFEDDKNNVKGFYIKNSFYMLIKMLDEIKEKLPPKYTKIYPNKIHFLA